MAKCTGSDRITALHVANDILKGYGDFAHLEANEYTMQAIQLARLFLDWAEDTNGEIQTERFSKFFNR